MNEGNARKEEELFEDMQTHMFILHDRVEVVVTVLLISVLTSFAIAILL